MVQRSQYFKDFPLSNTFKSVLEKIKQIYVYQKCVVSLEFASATE